GTVCAPGSKRFIERALTYLQIPASPELPPPPADIANLLYQFNPKVYPRKFDKAETVMRD
ncbi:MAG TPA: hypothetical protein VFC46_08660, partial [Humisphaera sp.]|nr:hypothetical protein [Humisphaera sp.]